MSQQSTDIIVYDKVADPGAFISQLGASIAKSQMFGCGNVAQGEVMAMSCMVKRLDPLSLAERYHIIHGRLSMKADAMLADFRTKKGGSHKILSRTAERAEIELTLDGQAIRFATSWEELKSEPFVYHGKESDVCKHLANGGPANKSLSIKEKYQTPRARMQMMWARVVSDGVRAMAPEIVAGLYTPEEVGDFDESSADAPKPAKAADLEVLMKEAAARTAREQATPQQASIVQGEIVDAEFTPKAESTTTTPVGKKSIGEPRRNSTLEEWAAYIAATTPANRFDPGSITPAQVERIKGYAACLAPEVTKEAIRGEIHQRGAENLAGLSFENANGLLDWLVKLGLTHGRCPPAPSQNGYANGDASGGVSEAHSNGKEAAPAGDANPTATQVTPMA